MLSLIVKKFENPEVNECEVTENLVISCIGLSLRVPRASGLGLPPRFGSATGAVTLDVITGVICDMVTSHHPVRFLWICKDIFRNVIQEDADLTMATFEYVTWDAEPFSNRYSLLHN